MYKNQAGPENSQALSFIVFSDDWGEHPSSCQHIFSHIIKDHPVIWVNTIGMRMPNLSLYDLRKAILKLKKMFVSNSSEKKSEISEPNLTVIQPMMLPFIKWSVVRLFNRKSVVRAVRRVSGELKLNASTMVITAPNACEYIGLCGEKKVIYYCVDDFSEWPGVEKELVQKMESSLIHQSDVFFATSQHLYEKIAKHGKNVNLLSHGVDVDFFSSLPKKEHKLFENIPSPRVGYFGLFDDRSDMLLLKEIAVLMPDVSFVITGNVETDVGVLQSLDNVFFTGSVPYTDLPAIAKGYNACMLPYKVNELTDSIMPLKIKEYIATGIPVISTPIKEALKLTDYIIVAHSVSEWKDALGEVLLGNQRSEDISQKRDRFLEHESWQEKSALFTKYSN
jgi:glycosyltransferase involved in cell wall biosynthesis